MKRLRWIGILCFLVLSTQMAQVSAATLSEGDKGDRVVALQQRLVDLGYNIPKIDGVFDDRTVRAVTTYQKHARLVQSGSVDEITWHFLMDYGASGRYGSKDIQRMINVAMKLSGTPYVWGGETPAGFDCSGFIQYVFKQIGLTIPRTADVQYEVGRKVMPTELIPGDLVFFTTYEPGASHDGIYLGDGRFIAANSGPGVTIASLNDPYWSSKYIGARRLI